MPAKKTADGAGFAREGFGDPAIRNVNPVIGANRPMSPEMYDELSVTGRPPKALRTSQESPATEKPLVLPNISVSRQIVGHELIRLRATEAAIERDLSRPAIGVGGVQVPHLVQLRQEQARGLDLVRAEIERLNNLDDNQVRQEAFILGAR